MRTPTERRHGKEGKCSRCPKKYNPNETNPQNDPKWYRVEDQLVCAKCMKKAK